MNSSLIKDPPELRQKFELFTAEQRSLNKKRLDLLESLRFVLRVHDKKAFTSKMLEMSYMTATNLDLLESLTLLLM